MRKGAVLSQHLEPQIVQLMNAMAIAHRPAGRTDYASRAGASGGFQANFIEAPAKPSPPVLRGYDKPIEAGQRQ